MLAWFLMRSKALGCCGFLTRLEKYIPNFFSQIRSLAAHEIDRATHDAVVPAPSWLVFFESRQGILIKCLYVSVMLESNLKRIQAKYLVAFALPGIVAGICAGLWWYDLGQRDADRWSQLTGSLSREEKSELFKASILIGFVAGLVAGGATSGLVYVFTCCRRS